MYTKVIDTVITQHAEEASFLWLLRDMAVREPHYSLNDLTKLDDRVEAHIDGLRIAGDEGWEICKEALAWEEAGEVFTAAVLAFESGNEDRIQTVLEAGSTKLDLSRGIISTLGWIPYTHAEKYIQKLLDSDSPDLRRIGLAACAIHRKDPGKYLTDALTDNNPLLKARALQAVGELGRRDLLSIVKNNLESDNEDCRFSAAWTATLLGNTDAILVLKSFASMDYKYKYREEAVKLAMRQMDISSAHNWQKELTQNPDTIRLALIGAGAIGDPILIPWIIDQMAVPELARVAGESFTMITGVDITHEDLEGEWPEGFESGPTENSEDEDIEVDPDEDLPWPEPQLIKDWWNNNKRLFKNGVKYLLGKPISPGHLQQVLITGFQRQRVAAAIEMAIVHSGQPLFEVRAPGFHQKQLLSIP
jgi:uncharacterized protein (TIGR02270 family)